MIIRSDIKINSLETTIRGYLGNFRRLV